MDAVSVADIGESLRYESPVSRQSRLMKQAAELGGRTRRKGQIAFQMLTAANRDPAWFTAPDTFDIRRTPNRHVAFGFGAHFCVGATLARVEGSIAVGTLIRCFPGRRLSIGPPQPRTARVTRCGSAPGRPAPASGGRRS